MDTRLPECTAWAQKEIQDYRQRTTDNNFVAYQHARAQARRTKQQVKRDSWRGYVSTINKDTPIGQVWSTIKRINKTYKPSLLPHPTTEEGYPDNPVDIGNALARRFSEISSSTNYDQRFLHNKRQSELTQFDFAIEDLEEHQYKKLFR